MSRIPNLKRINKEDFDKQYQTLIDRLAFPINSFMEQVRNAFDNNIDFNNLNQEIITLTVTVDLNGLPNIQTQWKSTLKTKVIGSVVIKASNLVTPGAYSSSTPFINFVQNNTLVNINQISGLQAGDRYELVILSIGA